MDPKTVFDAGIAYHHYANTAYPLTPGSFAAFRLGSPSETPGFLSAEWAKAAELSLYLHVPFCAQRCRFCEYAVAEGASEADEDEYVELLLAEMAMYAPLLRGKRIVGLDVGGGTPTKLSVRNLERLTAAALTSFSVGPDVTLSIETTPAIAARDPAKIAAAYGMGYRRISMGIQTVSEKLLNDLGREGTAGIYEAAAANIRHAGFEKFNVDLMYGFLHQSDVDFENTLRYASSLKPDYITLYRNPYKGTRLEGESGGVSLYRVIRQYRLAYRFLNGLGYRANPGKNTFSSIEGDCGTSDYLTRRVIEGTPYLGLGLGAQSFGLDYLAYNQGAATKSLVGYKAKVRAGEFPVQDIYRLPVEEAIAKMVSVAFYFGYVDLDTFRRRFGIEFAERFAGETAFALASGLLETKGRRLMLTERGADYINGVIPLFFSPRSKAELLSLLAASPGPEAGEKEFLKAYDIEEFPRPSLAVDIVALSEVSAEDVAAGVAKGDRSVLMIRRGEHPFMNDWALPGGFVRPGESAEDAARRELKDEAGIEGIGLSQLRLYSAPLRDPRGWIASCAFVAVADQASLVRRYGDDALDARLFAVRLRCIDYGVGPGGKWELRLEGGGVTLTAYLLREGSGAEARHTTLEGGGIAFDHAAMLADALEAPR